MSVFAGRGVFTAWDARAEAAFRGWPRELRAVVLESPGLAACDPAQIRNPDNFCSPKAASVYLDEKCAESDYEWFSAL